MDSFINAMPGLLALIIVLAVIVLSALSLPVPDPLWTWGGVVVGYFFGNVATRLQLKSR